MNESISLEMLPHKPPMRWITSALRTGENEIGCEAALPGFYGEGGSVSVLLGLEVLAQAAGVFLGATLAGETETGGRLVKVARANWTVDEIAIGVSLQAKVKWIGSSAAGLHHFSGKLLVGGAEVLEAEFFLLAGRKSE